MGRLLGVGEPVVLDRLVEEGRVALIAVLSARALAQIIR